MFNSILNFIVKYKIITKYLASSFINIPISLITGYLIFKNIDPYFMGIWSTLTVYEVYSTYLRLGIINGMNRELPFALGKDDKFTAYSLASTALYYTLINIALIFFVSLILFFFYISNIYKYAFIVLIIRVILNSYSTYVSGTFRSNDNFNTFSNIQFYMSFFKLLSSPLITLGFNGYLIWELLISFINTFLLHLKRPIKVIPNFNYFLFRKMIIIGLPIFVISTITSFIDTIPRLYLIKFGTEIDLGLYSPVFFLISTISLLPNQLSSYFYPKFTYNLAKTNSIFFMKQSIKKIVLFTFIFLVFTSVLIYSISQSIILFFPKYLKSLPYIQLALLATPFVLFRLAHTVSAVLKNYKTMVLFAIFYLIIQIISILILKSFNNEIVTLVIKSQIITYATLSIIAIFLINLAFKEYR